MMNQDRVISVGSLVSCQSISRDGSFNGIVFGVVTAEWMDISQFPGFEARRLGWFIHWGPLPELTLYSIRLLGLNNRMFTSELSKLNVELEVS